MRQFNYMPLGLGGGAAITTCISTAEQLNTTHVLYHATVSAALQQSVRHYG